MKPVRGSLPSPLAQPCWRLWFSSGLCFCYVHQQLLIATIILFFFPQKYHMLLSLNLNFNYFALFFYFLNGWDLIMAALQQLRGCSSAWSALSWLPWLNKCATTDLVSLVINRIHLFFFHPAVEYSKGPSYPVALSCSWHPILNYDPLINARNNPNLHIVAKWKQSVRFHWKIVFLITALHFREICLYLSL